MIFNRSIIGNLCDVGDGAHAKIKRTKSGVMYLTSKNFKLHGLDLTKLDYISEEDYNKHFREGSKALTKPIENDILMSIIGTMGVPYVVRSEDKIALSSSVAIIRCNERILPQYLYYWMQSHEFQESIQNFKSGSAQGFLSLDKIRNLPVIYPDKNMQTKIINIISKYDDLIENNLKRIKLLEESAELIYKEWFVNLRFPGYEKCEIVDGIPEGWGNESLGNLIKIIKGKKPKNITEYKTEDRIIYMLVETLERKRMNYTNDVKVPVSDRNELLMIMDGSRSGNIYRSMGGAIGSTLSSFNIVKNNITNEYLYYFIKYRENEIKQNNTGSAIPHANKNYINKMDINIPNEMILNKFTNIISNIHDKIDNLYNQNERLKEARDILIPRLISGEIEV